MMKKELLLSLTGVMIACAFPLSAMAAPGANPAAAKKVVAYVQTNNLPCLSCHAVGHKVVGPAWLAVAEKYQSNPNAVSLLTERIAKGGVGTWGNIPMPPNLATEAQAKVLAQLIMDLDKK